MTVKSLLEVQNTNDSESWMLLNIILSDFQQYRTLLAKVIQFFVSPEKCENQRYKFLTPDRRYFVFYVLVTLFEFLISNQITENSR